MDLPKRKAVFQSPIFTGYVSFREGSPLFFFAFGIFWQANGATFGRMSAKTFTKASAQGDLHHKVFEIATPSLYTAVMV